MKNIHKHTRYVWDTTLQLQQTPYTLHLAITETNCII